jgi:hypothetical protein
VVLTATPRPGLTSHSVSDRLSNSWRSPWAGQDAQKIWYALQTETRAIQRRSCTDTGASTVVTVPAYKTPVSHAARPKGAGS